MILNGYVYSSEDKTVNAYIYATSKDNAELIYKHCIQYRKGHEHLVEEHCLQNMGSGNGEGYILLTDEDTFIAVNTRSVKIQQLL